ncbi:hypothetical protein ACTFIY_004865 [Dictyostelium cf. discoideum]
MLYISIFFMMVIKPKRSKAVIISFSFQINSCIYMVMKNVTWILLPLCQGFGDTERFLTAVFLQQWLNKIIQRVELSLQTAIILSSVLDAHKHYPTNRLKLNVKDHL